VCLNSKRPKAKRATAYKKTFSLGINAAREVLIGKKQKKHGNGKQGT